MEPSVDAVIPFNVGIVTFPAVATGSEFPF